MSTSNVAYVYFGTYAKKEDPGIYVYTMDTDTGALTYQNSIAGIVNPSFLTINSEQNRLYAVSETKEFEDQIGGSVAAFAIQPETGQLTFLNQQPSYGEDPCHLSLDGSRHYLLLANYTGGSIALYPLQADGKIGKIAEKIQHHGKSIHPTRQEAAHPHSVNVDASGKYVLVPDLGQDKIITYKIDYTTQKLAHHTETIVTPGSGPRHLTFHPTHAYAYVINELTSTITTFNFNATTKTLHPIQTIKTLPEEFTQENTCAEIQIHPTGKFLYGSNRGHNSIVVFNINTSTGELVYNQHISTQGKTPRNFALTSQGKFLLVANQDSNTVVSYAIDRQTGKLLATGDIQSIPHPVCIKIVD